MFSLFACTFEDWMLSKKAEILMMIFETKDWKFLLYIKTVG